MFIIAIIVISICANSLKYTNSHNEKISKKFSDSNNLISTNRPEEISSPLTKNDIVAINTGK